MPVANRDVREMIGSIEVGKDEDKQSRHWGAAHGELHWEGTDDSEVILYMI